MLRIEESQTFVHALRTQKASPAGLSPIERAAHNWRAIRGGTGVLLRCSGLPTKQILFRLKGVDGMRGGFNMPEFDVSAPYRSIWKTSVLENLIFAGGA